MESYKGCISVIVAVYNVEPYIEKCLKSICDQTYDNLQIIVVDDGSTDDSGKICDDMAAKDWRIQVLHTVNAGVSAARNKGMEQAVGEYVAFVDGDDYLEADMYANMREQMEKTGSEMSICSFCYLYPGKIKAEISPISKGICSRKEYMQALLQDAFAFYFSVVWNKLFTRKILCESGVKFDEKLAIMEDFKFILEIIPLINCIAVCEEAYYNYRKDNQITATQREITFEESFCNRTRGYQWLERSLVQCNMYEENRDKTVDYLIRYLAMQYAKAVFSGRRKEQLALHRELKKRESVQVELRKASVAYRIWRTIYWNTKCLSQGLVQKTRKIIRNR